MQKQLAGDASDRTVVVLILCPPKTFFGFHTCLHSDSDTIVCTARTTHIHNTHAAHTCTMYPIQHRHNTHVYAARACAHPSPHTHAQARVHAHMLAETHTVCAPAPSLSHPPRRRHQYHHTCTSRAHARAQHAHTCRCVKTHTRMHTQTRAHIPHARRVYTRARGVGAHFVWAQVVQWRGACALIRAPEALDEARGAHEGARPQVQIGGGREAQVRPVSGVGPDGVEEPLWRENDG